MVDTDKVTKKEIGGKELRKLREELWIILPFFVISVYFFFGSFRYKVEASTVPMLIGGIMTILTGMRLYHIIFPKSRIGQFKEAGLAGEFDSIKGEIEEGTLKGKYEEAPSKEITFSDEKKAFFALLGSFVAFLLFGYLVGMFFVVIGTSYYYGYKKVSHILISLAAMFFIIYVVLFLLLEAPMDYGIVLEPILRSLRLI